MRGPDAMRGLIFDKDGTLFDFVATWATFTRAVLIAEGGGDPHRTEALAAILGFDPATGRFASGSVMIAEPVDVIARRIAAVTGAVDVAALTARLIAASEDVPQHPVTNLAALMDALRAMGLTLGVVTNDGEAPARRHLADAGLSGHMAFVAGYDSGHGAKPAPDPLHAFCDATGLDPDGCAMIGDSVHDMTAGRAAGMTCIGVLTGPADRATLAPHADVVLDSIADLPAWLTRDRTDPSVKHG
ncbi:phosphoglycolate phosphatase [Loktanella fryxellensis]|uniref:phosphoglycolate phosphatase n=1 Tax=Loktanella fryxellensis TaxID=245187 RepID=A0A1H8ERA5_9RHOB|nr:HAD family hydrolase [Loktanella fryxellensis]SEN21972.1 phosphoglycolate phosphatase [Loktanella fryxellensis]